MSGKKYDIAYAIPPAKESDKPRWINVGAVLETRNGLRIKLDSIPVGFNGWLALFEPKPRDANQQRPAQQAQKPPADDNGFNDSIPF